jgi:dihydroorotate dehydrogenase (fumarate)
MRSLFEEQIVEEQLATHDATDPHEDSFAEATTYVPRPEAFALGPDDYLDQVARIRQAVDVPVIGSLNGTTRGGWLEYASLIEEAGAHALELNLYVVATDPAAPAHTLEDAALELVRSVKDRVGIPIAIKLSSFYTSLPHFAAQLDDAGADALVIFNRFYQPDIDVDELEVRHQLHLSDPSELLLRLRWLAILSGCVGGSLAVTGGVHSALDAIKAVMCGAHAVQMVSALLQHGPEHLGRVREDLREWLEQNEYESLGQMQASMDLTRCPDPRAYERANYIRVLQSWWG